MMKWYVKKKTAGMIILFVCILLWGYSNRWSCVEENSEQVAHASDEGIRIAGPLLHINILSTMRSTLAKVPETTQLPILPTDSHIRQHPLTLTSPDTRQSPLSQTAPESDEVQVTVKLTVNRRKALLYGKARKTKSYLTIGIPTIRRPGVDYLEKTLYSLTSHSDASQQMSMVVVIFMVDTNMTWTKLRSKQLAGKYPKLIQSGFLQIVHPHDQSIYPDFTKIKRKFNDSSTRVAWRSKQNIDYAYLFSYSQNISQYYLQLEDDVITTQNYFQDIVHLINSNSNKFWYYLEFSHIGFIGKLIRSSDLGDLSEYFMMFFDEQPGDLLLMLLAKIKTQPKRIIAPKSLFQHRGIVSSLPGKTQKITDKYFKDSSRLKDSFGLNKYPRKRFYQPNPAASIETNIEVFSDNNPMDAYDLSNKFFWGVSPREGEYLRVIFDAPQNISRIFIDSGIAGKDSDILHTGELLASSKLTNEEQRSCVNATSITKFENGDVDTSYLNISLPVNIDCIIIAVMANQTEWLVIREIAIFLPGELETTEPSNPSAQIPSKESMKFGKYAPKKSDSFKPNIVPRNSTVKLTGYDGQQAIFKIRGHKKFYHPGHDKVRGVAGDLGDKNVKHFESESDVKQSPDMSQNTTSREQQYKHYNDSIIKTSDAKIVPKVMTNLKTNKYKDGQTDDIANRTDKIEVMQYTRKKFYHVNPPATIHTQIETFSGYKPIYAYDLSDAFFWGSYPKQGDSFLILLKSPQNVSRIYIDSGYEGKESDILQNARLLISTRKPLEDRACQNLGAIALFVKGDIDTKTLNGSLPLNIDCIAIEIMANQHDWIIIREIAVFLSGESETEKLRKTSSPHMRKESNVFRQTIKRNGTSQKIPVSKQYFGSVQTKNINNIKPEWHSPDYADGIHLNQNNTREDLGHRPQAPSNHRQMSVHNGKYVKNNVEVVLKTGNSKDVNIPFENGRHKFYQQRSDNRTSNSKDKLIQHRTSSLLQQNNTKRPTNIETNSERVSMQPEKTNDSKVVAKETTDGETSNVKRVPETGQRVNASLEYREERKYKDGQTDDNANETDKNVVTQYSRKKFYRVNPPATIHTQIETFSGYKPMYAYDMSDAFFWGSYPKQGDSFLILLKSPQNVSRIYIDSGYEGKESDILQNARLLISTKTPGEEERACQNLRAIALFVNGDVDTEPLNVSLPVNIDCIAIEITANQHDWIIIREIAVFLSGELETTKMNKYTSSPHLGEESEMLGQQTIKRPKYASKKSLGPVQSKYSKIIKPHWLPQGFTVISHLNPNKSKEDLGQRPQAFSKHRQISARNASDANINVEVVLKNGNLKDVNKPFENGRHKFYQQRSDNRTSNSKDKLIRHRTSSLLQQNNTKRSTNIETNSERVSMKPGKANDSKVVATVPTDGETSNVKRLPETGQRVNASLEYREERKYKDGQTDDTGNKTDKNVVMQYTRKRFYHVNPPATIHTQIETFSGYKPIYAYDLSDAFFWGSYPKQGDSFLILLKSPQNVSRIYIDSGYEGKESDILQNARLLISTRKPLEDRACQNLGAIALFVKGDIDTKTLNGSLPLNIDCIVIEIMANQHDWIIIREIAVFLSGELETEKLNKTSSPHTRKEHEVLGQNIKGNETSQQVPASKQSLGLV